MSKLLKYIASHDDLIKLVGTDLKIAEKHQKIYGDERIITFNPYISAASNPEVLANKKIDLWTKTGQRSKRKHGRFDQDKWSVYFIT